MENIRKSKKVFLLGIIGIVLTFGISASLIFADEIKDKSLTGKSTYELSSGSLDWDTFYRRMDQYAGQCKYYSVEVTDVYSSGSPRQELVMWELWFGFRFLYTNGKGLMVTMWLTNQPVEGWGAAQNFTDYARAEKFWNDSLQIMR